MWPAPSYIPAEPTVVVVFSRDVGGFDVHAADRILGTADHGRRGSLAVGGHPHPAFGVKQESACDHHALPCFQAVRDHHALA
jgi:hypothetical protein